MLRPQSPRPTPAPHSRLPCRNTFPTRRRPLGRAGRDPIVLSLMRAHYGKSSRTQPVHCHLLARKQPWGVLPPPLCRDPCWGCWASASGQPYRGCDAGHRKIIPIPTLQSPFPASFRTPQGPIGDAPCPSLPADPALPAPARTPFGHTVYTHNASGVAPQDLWVRALSSQSHPPHLGSRKMCVAPLLPLEGQQLLGKAVQQ